MDWSQSYVFWLGLFVAILAAGFAAAVLLNKWPAAKSAISTDQYINKPVVQQRATLAKLTTKPDQAIPVVDAQQLFVNQRLQATNSLLLNAKPQTILLQIKSVSSALPATNQVQDALLKTELEKLGQQLEMDNIYLYRMHQGGGIYTVILYGAYAQREDALKALKELPLEIKNNQPYLRTLAGVKKDIEHTATN
jgi:septal ring-binding cell division protein DamX